MSQNCARPGCGHPRDGVSSPYGDFDYPGHDVSGCLEVVADADVGPEVRCPCPAYRTPEQQAILADLAHWVEVINRKPGYVHPVETASKTPLGLVARALKAFP